METKFFLVLITAGICNNAFGQSNDQSIAPELVGKWCFINLTVTNDMITNSCITLNSDGSYEATLDRSGLPSGTSFPVLQDNDNGKWWVKDNQLFYTSTNNGQGSFAFQKANHPRLENTPMIMIGGVAFATATPRDPW